MFLRHLLTEIKSFLLTCHRSSKYIKTAASPHDGKTHKCNKGILEFRGTHVWVLLKLKHPYPEFEYALVAFVAFVAYVFPSFRDSSMGAPTTTCMRYDVIYTIFALLTRSARSTGSLPCFAFFSLKSCSSASITAFLVSCCSHRVLAQVYECQHKFCCDWHPSASRCVRECAWAKAASSRTTHTPSHTRSNTRLPCSLMVRFMLSNVVSSFKIFSCTQFNICQHTCTFEGGLLHLSFFGSSELLWFI